MHFKNIFSYLLGPSQIRYVFYYNIWRHDETLKNVVLHIRSIEVPVCYYYYY